MEAILPEPADTPEIFKDLRIINPDEKVIYCKTCTMSNQRPRVHFNSKGICGQCLYYNYKRNEIDWDKREKQLEVLCNKFRKEDGSWDVIVPGSGGKDSLKVVYTLQKKYGMHPLTVTFRTIITTDIGQQNFDNFVSQFDNLLFSPNGKIHQKLSKLTFTEFGDNFLPFAYGQIFIPQQIAVKYNIPFLMYGENGEVENGGSLKNWNKPTIDPAGSDYDLQYFTNQPPEYWVEKYGFDPNDIKNRYTQPSVDEMKKIGLEEHFFSYYDHWTPEKNYELATKNCGFKVNPDGRSEGTFTDYASLDDKTDGLHYYMAFIKFGIARANADAVKQIWNEIITRDEGVDLVQKYDAEFPKKHLKECLEYYEMDMDELNQIFDKFRRPIIWKKENNEWTLKQQVTKI